MVVTEVKHQALTKRHVDDHIGTQVWIKHCIFTARKIVNKKKRKIFAHTFTDTFTERNTDVPVQWKGGNHNVICHISVLKDNLFSQKSKLKLYLQLSWIFMYFAVHCIFFRCILLCTYCFILQFSNNGTCNNFHFQQVPNKPPIAMSLYNVGL